MLLYRDKEGITLYLFQRSTPERVSRYPEPPPAYLSRAWTALSPAQRPDVGLTVWTGRLRSLAHTTNIRKTMLKASHCNMETFYK